MTERPFTQWSPDTCGCVLTYYNDDISHHSSVQSCPKHAAQHGKPRHLADVLEHNRHKNRVQAWLADNGGIDGVSVGYDKTAPTDNDPLLVSGLPVDRKSVLQEKLDAVFGTSKTKVS